VSGRCQALQGDAAPTVGSGRGSLMASDGPPWNVIGASQTCDLTLRHAALTSNVATGFYVKPDGFRVLLPKVWYLHTKARVAPASPRRWR
jgi:hypothetical protein